MSAATRLAAVESALTDAYKAKSLTKGDKQIINQRVLDLELLREKYELQVARNGKGITTKGISISHV